MVDGRQATSQMIRLLVRSRDGHAKTDALGCGSHGRDHGEWFIDRPLCARDDGGLQVARAVEDVVTSKDILCK